MRRPRHQPPLDPRRLGRALAQEGMDLRHWVSYATVVAVDDDGEQDLGNANAIVISPASVDVDVVLEPSGYPMTCTHGIAHGTAFICAPIHVGDQVLVAIPDGSVSMVGRIVAVVSGPNGAQDAVPVGDDSLPIFKNDRLVIMAKGVPVDIRTDGGSQILVNPDGSISLNGGSNGVARVGDPVSRTLSSTDIINIIASAVAAGLVTPGGGGPPPDPVELEGEAQISAGSKTVTAGD